jgi:hypothetical protein
MTAAGRLAVVSFPVLSGADWAWIESVRAEHDPQAGRIGPHFTLVFPAHMPEAELETEVMNVASGCRAIFFDIAQARAMPGDREGVGYVFLVAGQGWPDIAVVHDRLCAGSLAPYLRHDIPFQAHITVASALDLGFCETLASHLNERATRVRGKLEALDLVRVAEGVVLPRRRFTLAGTEEALSRC